MGTSGRFLVPFFASLDLQGSFQDKLGKDPNLHGAMMVPLIVGSDKTLASNAMGLNEFHPLYISPGNVKNSVRRAHCDALIPIGFLAIPKSKDLVLHRAPSRSHTLF